jgi:hypothetical protein
MRSLGSAVGGSIFRDVQLQEQGLSWILTVSRRVLYFDAWCRVIESFDTPIVFLVFNRPSTTRLVFDAIAKARPTQLLVVADGARDNRAGEDDLCLKVRNIVAEITWPCKVRTNFSDGNLGCRERVISGLNWAFSLIEEAIILEDDCLPDPTFFPYCQQLLSRYRGDSRIGMISGNNLLSDLRRPTQAITSRGWRTFGAGLPGDRHGNDMTGI